MIHAITVKNFMAHSNLSVKNIPGINIIIGKNDTGKTGVLKLLYAAVKALEIHSLKGKSSDSSFKEELANKLNDTFMPRKNGLGDLVQKGSRERLEATITLLGEGRYKQDLYFSFGDRTQKTISIANDHIGLLEDTRINTLFIPAKEILTAFNDIRNIRNNFYGTGFDDTYLDLINALDLPTTKGKVATELSQVNKQLENLFEGKVEQTGVQDQPFIFKKGSQQFAMQLTAEGIKKIGILTTLINNRQLGKGTILFMDEPETALHPDAIRQLVEMLVIMSKAGVQIFIATHSYFVIKQFAVCAKRDTLSVGCWNFTKAPGQPVANSYKDLIDGILPSTSIIDEALRMYDQEIEVDLKA